MKVKLTDEEMVAKREELGRVLKDIAVAETSVTEAKERVKLATEHVNVLNEKHCEISRIVSSGEEERDGQIPLPLSKEEKKAAKKAGGEARRYEHKTEKRRFPTPKDEAPEQAQATG